MTTPAIIGFTPTPATSLRLVFNPIAANAIVKKNFDSKAMTAIPKDNITPGKYFFKLFPFRDVPLVT